MKAQRSLNRSGLLLGTAGCGLGGAASLVVKALARSFGACRRFEVSLSAALARVLVSTPKFVSRYSERLINNARRIHGFVDEGSCASSR